MLVFWTSSNTVPHTTYPSKFLAASPSETSRRATPSAVLIAALRLTTQKCLPVLLSPIQLAGGMECLQHQGLWLCLLNSQLWAAETLIPVRHHSRTAVLILPGHINPVSGDCMMGTVLQALHTHSVFLVEEGDQYIDQYLWLAMVKVRSWTHKYVPSPFCGVADATTSTLSSFPIPLCMDCHGHSPQAVWAGEKTSLCKKKSKGLEMSPPSLRVLCT